MRHRCDQRVAHARETNRGQRRIGPKHGVLIVVRVLPELKIVLLVSGTRVDGKQHIVERRELFGELRDLVGARQAKPCALMRVEPRHILPQHMYATFIGFDFACKLADQRALARTVGADDSMQFLHLNGQRNMIGSKHTAEALDQRFGNQRAHRLSDPNTPRFSTRATTNMNRPSSNIQLDL